MKALLWSGGVDSSVLLALMLERKEVFDIIQYRDYWTREQKKRSDELIKKWDLKVFTLPAQDIHLMGEGNIISAVFSLGPAHIVRDVVDGPGCLKDLTRKQPYPFHWTDCYVGTRKDDAHYINLQAPDSRWMQNGVVFHAPLWNLDRSEVVELAKHYGIDTQKEVDEGDLLSCSACVRGKGNVYCPREQKQIPAIEWSPEQNLNAFRSQLCKQPQ